MRVVVALGGSVLLEPGLAPGADVRRTGVVRAVRSLAPLPGRHELLITYGNGPQLEALAARASGDSGPAGPCALDTLGALTQGMIGYWLLQALQNALPGRQAMAMINQTLVSAFDPAFENPATFVGQSYDQAEAEKIANEHGWTVRSDGRSWRRVVPSPQPQRVIETQMIRRLVQSGIIVICAGGGGVPVVRNDIGRLQGVEALVNEDLTAAMLAESLEAGALLMLTDLPPVVRGLGTPGEEEIGHTTPHELRAERFPAGPMGPKMEAACRFVERTGGMAAIGRVDDCEYLLTGTAGAIVTPNATWPLASTL